MCYTGVISLKYVGQKTAKAKFIHKLYDSVFFLLIFCVYSTQPFFFASKKNYIIEKNFNNALP